MKDPSNEEDYHKAYDAEQNKEEKPQTNDQFMDKNGMKYEKIYNGHLGIYVWEVTRS